MIGYTRHSMGLYRDTHVKIESLRCSRK